MARVTGKVLMNHGDLVLLEVTAEGVSDQPIATRRVPGFELLADTRGGEMVEVEAEIIPPRTSNLTHLAIKEIIRAGFWSQELEFHN